LKALHEHAAACISAIKSGVADQTWRVRLRSNPGWSWNMTQSLNITPLANAVTRLAEGWVRYERDITDTQIRDGLIQRFEFSYEISHKLLKRHLEAVSADPSQFDGMPFSDLIRSAIEVVRGIPDFLEEVRYLLRQLQERNR
jgi:hypothetical protein